MSGIFPIGVANALEHSQVNLAICGGREFAVWRNSNGELHAFNNRCPHCCMQLHDGFIDNDCIHCAYHGWSYDGRGRCQGSPIRSDLRSGDVRRMQSFAVVEHHGLLWLSIDGDRLALQRWLSRITVPAAMISTPVRSIYLRAEFAAVRSALATAHLPPCSVPDVAAYFLESDGESATWQVGKRQLPIVYQRTLAAPGVGSALVRGEGLRPQGLLYGLQQTGLGLIGIHISALWEGSAPLAYQILLSRHLRRIQGGLARERELGIGSHRACGL